MNIATTTTARTPSARGQRRPLSQLLLDGYAVMNDYTSTPYYARSEYNPISDTYDRITCDPLVLAFVGKFGTRLIDEIKVEARLREWTEYRVWDREHFLERITRAINGGLPEVHRRLHEYPKLYAYLCERGFRHTPWTMKHMRGPRGVSVFRAVAYMTNPLFMSPTEIAAVLKEHRL